LDKAVEEDEKEDPVKSGGSGTGVYWMTNTIKLLESDREDKTGGSGTGVYWITNTIKLLESDREDKTGSVGINVTLGRFRITIVVEKH
jgi:hypothetical protein